MGATLDKRDGKAHDPAVAATDHQGQRPFDHLGRAVAVHAGMTGNPLPDPLSLTPAGVAATTDPAGVTPSPKATTKRKGAKR